MKRTIDIFADEKAVCGESPLWDVSEQRLVWVDNGRYQMQAGTQVPFQNLI